MSSNILSDHNPADLANAFALFQRGDKETAEEICRDCLRVYPNHPDALHLLGLICYERQDHHCARSWISKALSVAPHRADFHNDMGLVCIALGQSANALSCFATVLSMDPQKAEAHYNKGLAYKCRGDSKAAADAFNAALHLNPDYASAHFSLGNLLLDHRDYLAAERHFRSAIRIKPDYIAAYNHLSTSLEQEGRLEEARQCLASALRINPRCAVTLCNSGNLARKSYQFTEAIKRYRQALEQRPDFVEAHFNLAMVFLLLKDFKNGWLEYEWRLGQFAADSGYPNRHGWPLWQGQDLKGKSILVYDEQGFGDVIMFSRYLVKLKALGARVVFEVRQALFDLFSHLPLIDETVIRHNNIKPETHCDYCIPLASLPGQFQTDQDTIPDDVPYLFADPAKTARWSRRITGKELKVGLVWRGSDTDRSRRCRLEQFEPLLGLAGIRWYSLQIRSGPGTAVQAQCGPLVDIGPDLNDFTDTAAVIANLDLVVTIDTAVAHLAGAMGKPVWVLLPFVPDWRWFLDGKQTPWYRTMRLYRQPAPGDWENPLEEIGRDLTRWISEQNRRIADQTVNENFAAAYSCQVKGAFENAEAGYRCLLSLVPDHHPALAALGLLYLKTERPTAAVQTLQQALALKPDDPLCLNNLGVAFQRLGETERAISFFASAIACRPDFRNACHNLGNAFWDLKHLDGLTQWYAKALEIDPDDANAQWEMGKLYLKQLDLDRARQHFEQSVALQPQFVPARISLATTTLMQADFATGWKQYRWRFKDEKTVGTTYPGRFRIPQWQGEAFPGKRLIIHCEQGLGDSIQFSRFLPQIKALGGQVTFQVQGPLLPLFRNFPGIDILQNLPARQPDVPNADLYCPLLDVADCLRISIQSIPAPMPYLTAEPAKVGQWRRRFDSRKLNIGVVWAGNPDHTNDRKRSCNLRHWLELDHLDGIQLYSLQKEIDETDHELLAARHRTVLLGDDFKDMSDTAAAIACLDLVISVDTAVAHLAGAMGKPVWLMLPFVPDWRWMLSREDSPWYPTMRLFRQPRENAWAPVILSIKQQLENDLHGTGPENTH